MENTSNETITIRKDTLWKYSTFFLIGVVIIMGFFLFSGKGVTDKVVADNPAPSLPTPTERVTIDIGDAAVLGEEDAPVTIVEFSDFECPFCGRAFTQTYPTLKDKYVETGKVKWVYKNFPLSFHQNAQKAAEAAACAKEQDKFWEMHDKLFSNQQSLSVANYKIWAKELGLKQSQFDSCLDSGKYASKIQADFVEGQKYGVQGTPAFFVNGQLISGAQPLQVFEAAIEAELE